MNERLAEQQSADPSGPVTTKLVRRPTGSFLLALAVACVALALLLVTLAYSGQLPGPRTIIYLGGAAAALQIAAILAVAGTVVRAIWFLPGDEEKRLP